MRRKKTGDYLNKTFMDLKKQETLIGNFRKTENNVNRTLAEIDVYSLLLHENEVNRRERERYTIKITKAVSGNEFACKLCHYPLCKHDFTGVAYAKSSSNSLIKVTI